jgi:hypothetical protein
MCLFRWMFTQTSVKTFFIPLRFFVTQLAKKIMWRSAPPYSVFLRNFNSHMVTIVIINLLMSPQLGHTPYGLLIRRTCHSPSSNPSVGWWVLTTANAAETNVPSETRSNSRSQIFSHLSNGWLTLPNFLDRTLKRTDRGAIELLCHNGTKW